MAKGFFNIEPKPIKSKGKTKAAPKVFGCDSCGLDRNIVEPIGEGNLKVLILDSSPNSTRSDKFIKREFEDYNYSFRRSCYKLSAVACHTPDNRYPTSNEIKCCRARVLKQIEKLDPTYIITLGKPALETVINNRIPIYTGSKEKKKLDPSEMILKWVGKHIPDQLYHRWIFPMLHLDFVMEKSDDKVVIKMWDDCLESAIEIIDQQKSCPDYGDESAKVKVITNPKRAISVLKRIIKNKPVTALDYEGTGLKPQADNQKLICISISTSPESSYSFPIFYDDSVFMSLLKEYLMDVQIRKIAQNTKFEDIWSRVILGVKLRGIDFDTMLASHVLDNNEGVTGLKFQTYVRYGTVGYDDAVSQNIKSDKLTAKKQLELLLKMLDSKNEYKLTHGAYAINNLKEVPIEETLLYCGLDSMFTNRLAVDQKWELRNKPRLTEANDFLLLGLQALADVECNGIHVDTAYYEKKLKRLDKIIARTQKKIDVSPEMIEWKKVKGTKFNPGSHKQKGELWFDILGYESTKKTQSGGRSTDAKVIAEIAKDSDLAGLFESITKTKAIQAKINEYYRETVKGIMHPVFNLHLPVSYRGSCDSPNFQNAFNRNDKGKKALRTGIIPRPGRQIGEVDYRGIEVRMEACNTLDPKLIKYINDSASDMHLDTSKRLFKLSKQQSTTMLRYYAKNQFVFPEFYGSWFKQCADNLWRESEHLKTGEDILVHEHLQNKGIKNLTAFQNHVKKVEDEFWDKFSVTKEWMEGVIDRYQQTGEVPLLTGFVCRGLMSKNQLLNYHNQGPAFHCLMWSFIRLNQILKDEKFETLIIGQIHDSIVFDFVPDELAELKPIIRRVMCEDIREDWFWIIVSLDIDMKISEIDGSWYSMKDERI